MCTAVLSASEPRQREIRVFISSTFRDMQEEREELVKQIFPQLRRLCESRGVTWGEVDLRWGIPDEAKAEGKVLPLCLAEIERCRPYFIGLLGERYGWVPEEIPDELIEAQPWLTKYRKESVTALEILHGVLLNREMAGHAFFYFRDPAYAASRAGFTEGDRARRERLAALKEDIRKSGFPVAENFATPKQLGEWVLRDITAFIEKLYPESSIPEPLDRAAADHEAYAASRCRVYIGRPEYMTCLDAHAGGDGPPLVLTGESGGGKSALLANWIGRYRQQHASVPVIAHFLGAAADGAAWMEMLRRILGEFVRACNIEVEIPSQPGPLRDAFAAALPMAAAHGPVVLLIDGLNQIEDRDGAPDLVWLPSVIPPQLRLVLSTLPGRPLDALRQRGWPMLHVEPLRPTERADLTDRYLSQFAKQLSGTQRQRVVAAPQAANPLYLTTLLNELRLFGSHDLLSQRIEWYLQAASPLELYGKVLQRWEQDYEPDGSGAEDVVGVSLSRLWAAKSVEDLVGESLSRLWAARRGLSETELLQALGTPQSPLPRALWSPLFLAAGDALLNRGGLLTFAHQYLRDAVKEAYLPRPEHRQNAHLELACFFRIREGTRQLEELPWQWQQAGEWWNLAECLTDPAFSVRLWERDRFDMKAYWARVEEHSPLRMEQVCAGLIEQPERSPVQAQHVGRLLEEAGRHEVAEKLLGNLARFFREDGDLTNLHAAMGEQAVALFGLGRLDEALALHQEEERFCRRAGNLVGLQSCLGNQAIILYSRRRLDEAMILLKEKESLCRALGDQDGLRTALGTQALILRAQGESGRALALHREEERLCRQLGNRQGLAVSLGNQAAIAGTQGDTQTELRLREESERLSSELGNPAADINWLMMELPPQCRMVLSTTDVARSPAGSRRLELGALPTKDAEGALAHWLHDTGRELRDWQREKILAYYSGCGLPLYLRLAFEESRRWKSFDEPEACALREGLVGIIDILLDRLSSGGSHGSFLVSRSLGYLATARYGLTEDEMLDVLTEDESVWQEFDAAKRHDPPERRLPVIVWSRLFLDLEPYLMERAAPGGTVATFYHRHLRERIDDRYLAGSQSKERHEALAGYFGRQSFWLGETWRQPNARMTVELVYQQRSAGLVDAASATLTDLGFVAAKCSAGLVFDLQEDYHQTRQAPGMSKTLMEWQDFITNDGAHFLALAPALPQIVFQQAYNALHYPGLAAAAKILESSDHAPRLPWFRVHEMEFDESLLYQSKCYRRPFQFSHKGGYLHIGCLGAVTSKRFVAGYSDGWIAIWEADTGLLAHYLQAHAGPVQCIAGLGGSEFATGGHDGMIRIWDAESGRMIRELRGHQSKVLCLKKFGTDGLVSGSADTAVGVWNLKKEAPVFCEGHTGSVHHVAVFDDRYAVSAAMDYTIRIWDLKRRRGLRAR
jgi:hypothetical protein